MLNAHHVIAIYLHQLAVNFEGANPSWSYKPQRSANFARVKLPM
jgi:hypothetical protein